MTHFSVKSLLMAGSWKGVTPYLVASVLIHLAVFAFLLSLPGFIPSQALPPPAIEVDLSNLTVGGGEGGGGGGGSSTAGAHLRREIKRTGIKGEERRGRSEAFPIAARAQVGPTESIRPDAPATEAETKVASIDRLSQEAHGTRDNGEDSAQGGGLPAPYGSGSGMGGGTGSGAGSGTGSGTGSGVGSGIGSGSGSGKGAGEAKGGGGLRDELREFQRRIKERIERVKSYPFLARKNQYEGSAYCAFTLLRDGGVKDVRIVGRSGYPVLDGAAARAIMDAAPYPPFPGCIEHPSIEVKIPIVFKLKDLEG